MTRNARIALILAAVAVAAVAAIAIGTGGDDEPASTPATAPATSPGASAPARSRPAPIPAIRLRDGRPAGGVRTLEFRSGQRVRFAVTSDTDEEIHVHGYDVTRAVPAGRRVTVAFPTGAQGIFEIESHTTGRHLASLKVVP